MRGADIGACAFEERREDAAVYYRESSWSSGTYGALLRLSLSRQLGFELNWRAPTTPNMSPI